MAIRAFSRGELLWIECALETELGERDMIRLCKVSDKIDDTQDKKDIAVIEALLEKIRQEAEKG
jgi:hypothetical protein